ncbi:uncharacterized protein LOC117650477 [Thrips palmi]|uniref:Uncharacterized protein LOC117650477 n=1 Tax=Thrips palmi TaxID=161013 RepID=A0A6P8ZWR6_THRPL|nr:uncharacterized protein LOC117650477 [Thrips palmi]
MWAFDNLCASETMQIPLRHCKEIEDESTAEFCGATSEQLMLMKQCVRTMWEKASTVLEFFTEESNPDLGFRIRAKKSLPFSIKFLERDYVEFGWTASCAPVTSKCYHLYERSPIHVAGYLGGPLSYLNWKGKHPNTTVTKSYKGPESFSVYIKSSPMKPGDELFWDYGSPSQLPEFGKWFNDKCCSIIPSNDIRCDRSLLKTFHQNNLKYLNKECCVLCGKPFSVSPSGRIQKKPHFIDSHADFLGSYWDGIETFDHEVDGQLVLRNADTLNSLLASLAKMKWKVIPACNVFTLRERKKFASSTKRSQIMGEFFKRSQLLREAGTLAVRGTSLPSAFEHLFPIQTSTWGNLRWKNGSQPKRGHYGIPKDISEEHEQESAKQVQQYVLQIVAGGSDGVFDEAAD